MVEVESQVETTERLVYPAGTFPPAEDSLSLRRRKLNDGLKVNRDSARPPPALLPCPLQIWPWPAGPSLVKGDGDGTVNIRSLKVGEVLVQKPVTSDFQGCLRWSDKQKQPVTHKEFPGINHVDMLRKGRPSVGLILQDFTLNFQTSQPPMWSQSWLN